MRRSLLFCLFAAAPALAGMNRVYLVPALKECPGPATCTREFESTYTFDSIVLRNAAAKYSPPGKPALSLDLRGVRDGSGTPFTGSLSVHVLSGRVSIPGFGTLPDGSPLAEVAPVPVTLKNGNGKVSYSPPASPSGLISNGGGVEVVDPDGKVLAVTGSQTKP